MANKRIIWSTGASRELKQILEYFNQRNKSTRYSLNLLNDIEYLTNLVPCTISVVTKVAPAHIEFFGSIEAIAREKQKIITHLKKDNFAILNFDDDNVRAMEKNTKAQVLSFGYSADSKVRAIDLEDQGQGLEIQGIKFKISYNGSSVPVFLPGVIGAHQIYSAMAAAAVGGALGMNLIDISIGLKEYRAPKGRMNLIKGIKNSLIVDDTYNSSPEAAKAAVEAVAKINPKDVNAKIAIMGDMLELGSMTEEAHYTLGKLIAENGYNYIIAVGKYRDYIIKGARENGLEGFTQGFENSEIAKNQIRQIINDKDVVLVKGSQGSRMEKIVKALMLEPEKAEELLIRQTNSWLRN